MIALLCSGVLRFQHAAAHLVEFDAFEQRLEVALAKALVALALDDLEKDRADDGLGEDLQQQAFFRLRRAVEQDAIGAQALHRFTVARQAFVEQFVIGVGGAEKLHPGASKAFHRGVDVVGGQRNVLNTLAVIAVEILLNLSRFLLPLLVDGDADLAAGAGHGLALHPGHLALDIEVADLAEVEQPGIEIRPFAHAAAVHVVGEVIDGGQAGAHVLRRSIVHWLEVHVVNRDVADAAVAPILAAPAIDEVDQAVADTLDRRDVQLHRAAAAVEAPGAQFQRALVGGVGVVHTEGNGADAGAVQPGEALRERVWLGVDDEVDAALAPQGHVLVTMAGHRAKAELGEQSAELFGLRRGILDKLEAVGAHGVRGGGGIQGIHAAVSFFWNTQTVGQHSRRVSAKLAPFWRIAGKSCAHYPVRSDKLHTSATHYPIRAKARP